MGRRGRGLPLDPPMLSINKCNYVIQLLFATTNQQQAEYHETWKLLEDGKGATSLCIILENKLCVGKPNIFGILTVSGRTQE